jgi:Na+/melibiose symporter-like transporter
VASSALGGGRSPALGVGRKSVYALGDFTINTGLSALSLIYAQYFLVQFADLRPALAGLIPLIGRTVDAFTDPLMGRISDGTRWRAGRRRPYFLIGALPYGASFALLWLDPPLGSQAIRFGYYTLSYCLLSLSMTVLSIPYLAILPEMAVGYDERTSLNTFRNVGSTLGIVAAVSIPSLADALGGGAAGFARAGVALGVVLALPWLAVHRVTFERPDFQTRAAAVPFFRGLGQVMRHRAFMRLTWLYIAGRIAMDLAGALFILFVTYWLGRRGDFEPVMYCFLAAVVIALPAWLRVSRGRDKAAVFVWGCLGWAATSLLLGLVQPDWPRWLVFTLIPLAGFGFALVDLMPWSMVGEVIDEDELTTGERREGVYNGVFMFLRKLGGGLAVALVLGILDLAGYQKGEVQTETARQAIRWLTAVGPTCFLLVAVWIARSYPLTRQAHGRILEALGRGGSTRS